MKCCICGYRYVYRIRTETKPDRIIRVWQCGKCNRRFGTDETYNGYKSEEALPPLRGAPTNRSVNYYTVYDAKTDKVMASGNAIECAEALQMGLISFYGMVTRVRKGETKRYAVVVDNLKEDDGEEE